MSRTELYPQESHGVTQEADAAQNPTQKMWVSGAQVSLHILKWFVYSLPQMEWIKLLALPLVIAAASSIITGQIQQEVNQSALLKNYFEQLSELVFKHNLLTGDEKTQKAAAIIARGRTITALRELNIGRRRHLLAFLQASNLTQNTTYSSEKTGKRPLLSFEKQNLSGLDLSHTGLQYVDFLETNLSNTNLSHSSLNGVTFYKANLRGANLRGADLRGANLDKADLDEHTQIDKKWHLVWEVVNQGAPAIGKWHKAHPDKRLDLREANLYKADLRGADLRGADLQGAGLQKVDLQGANLQGANLQGANLQGENNLTQDQLDVACLDGNTRLSDGLIRPSSPPEHCKVWAATSQTSS
jgi:uncharacterized protein YjbI with pentapeptide repeats